MTAPLYSAADYLAALQSLMPRGRAWPRDPDSEQAKILSGMAPIYERQNQRANNLLVDAFPSTSKELLPEWESSLGIVGHGSARERSAKVLARFSGSGGQSKSYMISYAKNLGFKITIKEFSQARIGCFLAGMPIMGAEFSYAWEITTSKISPFRFRSGNSSAGDPLTLPSKSIIEPEMVAISPLHTTVIFKYI